jgi:uncharacterized protein with von Willebrand factor type A (vWA) domain
MAKIITQQIYQGQTKQVRQDLNSILKRWKWGDKNPQNSEEFLTKMGNWVNDKFQEEKELKEFLKRKKAKSLSEIKDTDPKLAKELEETKRLKQLADDCIIKISKKLNITKNDPDYTYEGIYKVFEERLEGWEKPKRK